MTGCGYIDWITQGEAVKASLFCSLKQDGDRRFSRMDG